MATPGRSEAFTLVDDEGARRLEAVPGRSLMSSVADAALVVEACLSACVSGVLLRPEHLPARFFDLSSGEAGEVLQKLRTYGIRLAVVAGANTVHMSRRFGELLAEELTRNDFRVFESRSAAAAWLGRT